MPGRTARRRKKRRCPQQGAVVPNVIAFARRNLDQAACHPFGTGTAAGRAARNYEPNLSQRTNQDFEAIEQPLLKPSE
jgi:hypothetical protein